MNRMMQAQSQPQAMLVSSLPDDKDQERGGSSLAFAAPRERQRTR
jgi:hypothetical protein